MNRNLSPNFNQEIGSSIINRYSLSKVPSVTFNIHRKITNIIIDMKKKSVP
jgi:hypothetical protein